MTTIPIDRAEAEKLLDQEAMKALSDAQKSLNELNALQDELQGVAKQIRALRNQIKQTGLRGNHG